MIKFIYLAHGFYRFAIPTAIGWLFYFKARHLILYILSYKKAEVETPAHNAQKRIKTNINKTRQNKVNHSRSRLFQITHRNTHLYTHQ